MIKTKLLSLNVERGGSLLIYLIVQWFEEFGILWGLGFPCFVLFGGRLVLAMLRDFWDLSSLTSVELGPLQ